MVVLEPVKCASLRSQVVEKIREAIFRGSFAPGTPLRESVLARSLGVSQSTVREALLQLEHAGLVIREPNRRTTVTRLSQEDIRERVELRSLLEVRAGIAAAARMGEAEFARLEERLGELERAIDDNDYFGAAQADIAFHRCFWESSGNRTLTQTLDVLTAPLFAFMSLRRSDERQRLLDTVREHRPILEALKSRDEQRIAAVLRDHIEASYRE